MQIPSVFAGYPDLAGLVKRGPTVEATGSQPAEAAQQQTLAATGGVAAMAEILSDYDVTDISPAEFSEMIQKLFEAGALSEDQLRELATVRMDLDLEDVEADESIDLLEFYVEKIKSAQHRLSDSDATAAERQQLAPLLGRLDWLEKFALIQSAPDAVGLDTLA